MDLPELRFNISEKKRYILIRDFNEWVNGYLDSINLNPDSDAEYATAKLDIDQCRDLESRIKEFRDIVLDKSGVSELIRLQSSISESRLSLDKLVKSHVNRKKQAMMHKYYIKAGEIREKAQGNLKYHFNFPVFDPEPHVKHKRSVLSCESALNKALEEYTQDVASYMNILSIKCEMYKSEIYGYEFLFQDPVKIIEGGGSGHIKEVVSSRINSYKKNKESGSYKNDEYSPGRTAVHTSEEIDFDTGELIENKKEMVVVDKTRLIKVLQDVVSSMNKLEIYDDSCEQAYMLLNEIL